MTDSLILGTSPLGFVWDTPDPFLFCVHHDDRYPKGNDRLGPDASLAGRDLGMDFEPKDGWRMYHGSVVPGFPRHPHRGFETVTLARRGFIDHSDSLGATARFGRGDAQWMTAGRGIEHAEMFPLLSRDEANLVELFQIWINLPRADKRVAPHFSMLWSETIPTVTQRDASGKATVVTLVAGALGETRPPAPPPHSWAARPDTDVAIWTIRMEPGAQWRLPAAQPGTQRMLYFFAGGELRVGTDTLAPGVAIRLRPELDAPLVNGDAASELLLLQGKPIGEPVVQHGPFVMNSRQEIVEAFQDYQRGEFGRWPWGDDAPVHAREESRHARHADGKLERP